MNDNKPTRRPTKKRGAPKGNSFAAGQTSKSGRRMTNFTSEENETITKHLKSLDMSWPEWSKMTLLQAVKDES